MSRLGPNQLTARKVETLKSGTHSDGGNLWITVEGGSRRIGSAREVSLAEARDEAAKVRKQLRDGIDPIDQRKVRASERQSDGLTFQAVAERYIAERKPEWRDPRAAPTWESSLARLAHPYIGAKPIATLTTADVLTVLRPIWTTMTETADRVRGRIERILDYAATHGWRQGENPARWRGHLSNILPKPSAVARVEHHSAVAWKDIARVMARLAHSEGTGALAVRFACLTAARSNEVRSARWSEIDLQAKVWTVPSERMKARREHRVPLSEAAIKVLDVVRLRALGPTDLIFRGGRVGRPLSDVALSKALHQASGTTAVTVHGLRSTFRDWVAEAADYPRDVAEMSLAHAIGDKVEAAYRRGDLFEKRRAMMEEWGRFAAAGTQSRVISSAAE